MRYKSLLIFFLMMSFGCSEKRRIQKMSDTVGECKKTWVYFKLERPVRGKVLSYAKGMCGYFAISSNTIVLTSAHDTIRVLQLPCNGGVCVKSDSVLVTPVTKVDSAGAIGDRMFDCRVKRTCFADVTKIQ
jgi:hypothetical protein